MTRGADDDHVTDREIARYGLLDSPPGRELQALVELAALVCDVPTAAINVLTGTHQHQIAATGIEPSVCAREDSMCAVVVEDASAVTVPDARLDRRFSRNPFVTGEIGAVRFYASAPLVTRQRVTLGRLCVFDDVARELDEEQQHALEVVAERMVDVLELRIRSQQLERSLHELTRTRDELRRSNEKLSTFAGQVSHDLRTPLTAMLLNTELVAEDPTVRDDEDLSRLLDAAMHGGRRMSRLIDDLLDFARVGAQLRLEPVDLDALVDEVRFDLCPRADDPGQGIEVTRQLGVVTGDRQQLYTVFLNLLTNGLKFTRPGVPPRVAVTSVRTGAELTLEVSDNGVGVPPEEQERVFDLFARGERSVPGSGIGLATVRAAVEAHGGSVGVRSAPGGGTTFWFSLPCGGETRQEELASTLREDCSMDAVARRVRVHGTVQGVFFRDACREEARRSGVTGWVRNDDDGTVTAHFEGEPQAVELMVEWCRTGPPRAAVHGVEQHEQPPEGHTDFAVR